MTSVKDIIDRYKRDENKNILDLLVCYVNRTPTTNLKWVSGRVIVRADAGFLDIRDTNGTMTHVPFHRVTMIKDKGQVIFDRNKAQGPY